MVVTTIFVESRNLQQTPKPPSRKWWNFFVSQTPFFGCCCHNNLAECLECKYGYSTQKFHWYVVVVNRFLALSDKLCQS